MKKLILIFVLLICTGMGWTWNPPPPPGATPVVANDIKIFAQIFSADQFNDSALIADLGNKYKIVLTNFAIESHVAAIKATNPETKVLLFINPYGGWGDRFFIPPSNPTEIAQAIEDYGLRNSSDEVMNFATDGVTPLMDVTNELWKDELSEQAIQYTNSSGADGIFLDTIEQRISVPFIVPEFPKNYTAESWSTGTQDFLDHVLTQMGDKETWINTGTRAPDVALPLPNQDLRNKAITGETMESFGVARPIDTSESDLEWYINQTILNDLATLATFRPTLIEVTGSTDTESLRLYALCGYLLISNDNTYFYYTTTSDHGTNLVWRDEWNAAIGTPSGAMSVDSSGVYVRNFTKGRVVVNATETTKTYHLGKGYIHWGGNHADKVLTVDPHSAYLLLKRR